VSKRKDLKEVVLCPNGCGKKFELNFNDKPKGLAKHLEECGGALTFPLREFFEKSKINRGL
jgi:hypothetical protein